MTQSAICSICKQQYNHKYTAEIITKVPYMTLSNNDNICLNCIKKINHTDKEAKLPHLKELRTNMLELELLYRSACSEWQALAKEYQDLDYQENIINHLTKKPAPATKKPSAKKKSSAKKATKANAALAMKVLANLTPAQQETILANLAAQANQIK